MGLVVLGALEVGQHLVVRPAGVAERRPSGRSPSGCRARRAWRWSSSSRPAPCRAAGSRWRPFRPFCGTVLKAQLLNGIGSIATTPAGAWMKTLLSGAAGFQQADRDRSGPRSVARRRRSRRNRRRRRRSRIRQCSWMVSAVLARVGRACCNAVARTAAARGRRGRGRTSAPGAGRGCRRADRTGRSGRSDGA